MRLGLFGGSFDPVHRGHLALAEACRRQTTLDQVLFIPAAKQPLKPHGPIAPDDDRVAMIEAAIAGRPAMAVSTIEIDRRGTSYTVDTLAEIARRRPDDELYFLMGEDSLNEFAHWREPARILELACPLVVVRWDEGETADHSLADARRHADLETLRPFASPERWSQMEGLRIEMPPNPISSTEIVRRIRASEPWDALVPPAVATIIRDRGLYQAAATHQS